MTLTRKTPLRRVGAKKAVLTQQQKRWAGIVRKKKMARKRRTATEFSRIYGSKARVAWVKAQCCIYCAALSPFFGSATAGTCHNAHTVTGGTGRKADYTTIIPLCPSHHRRYDQHQAPFDTPEIRVSLQRAALVVEARWLAAVDAGEWR